MNRSFSVIAGTLYGNRGAELMVSVVVGRLRDQFPEADFHVFSYMAEDDRRECVDESVVIHSASPVALVAFMFPGALIFGLLRKMFGLRALRLAPASIRALGESSCLFDVAGVSFIDGREKFLPFNVLTLWPAMLLGVPVIKLSQAIGPITSRPNRMAARWTLPFCQRIWARGDTTWSNLATSCLPRLALGHADDLAFLYEDRYCLSRRLPRAVEELRRWSVAANQRERLKGIVGVCPSSVLGNRKSYDGVNYELAISTLVEELVATGFGVFLFPNATRARAAEAERNNDLPLIRRIAARVQADTHGETIHCVLGDVNASDIEQMITLADVLLVSRFHAMVAALNCHRPVIVIGWSHKYAEVMLRFGLQRLVYDHKGAGSASLLELVVQVNIERDEIAATIRNRMPVVKAASARQLEWLSD